MEDWTEADKNRVKQLILEHKLDEYEDTILDRLRPCILLASSAPDDYSQSGNTRLAGMPDLPEGVEWPHCNGKLLSLISQVNLSELPAKELGFPRRGWLACFLGQSDSSTDINSAVLYFTDTPRRRHPPGDVEWDTEYDKYAAAPHHAKLIKTVDLPHDLLDPEWADIESNFSEDELYDFIAAFNQLHPVEHNNGNDYHQLGGYLQQFQGDDRVEVFPGYTASEIVPIFQAGWDRNTGFSFWDAGVLYFGIDKSDLAAHRFEKSRCWLQSC